MKSKSLMTTASAAAFFLSFATTSAAAQEAEPLEQGAAEIDDQSRLAVVYVTATKRNESAQSVPITLNVVDGELLADRGVGSMLQIESIAPGVQLVRSPTGKSRTGVTIRGLGSSPGTSLFESSVSLFIDGVYAPRSREFTSSLFDIERIEVIKGTQAALLGKNTSAGAINVIPRTPGDEFSAELTAGYEFELGTTNVMGAADLPITDTLKLRLAAQYTDQGGWTENVISGQKATTLEDLSVRGVLVYEPNSDMDFTLLAQTSSTDLSGTPAEIVVTSPLAEMLQAASGFPGTISNALNRKNANGLFAPGQPAGEELNNDRVQFTANFDIGGHTLTSISGWSAYQSLGTVDGDGLAANFLYQEDTEKSAQFLQEVRLVSPNSDVFEYIVGGMYMDNLLKGLAMIDVDYPFGPAPGVNIAGAYQTRYNQSTKAWSGFAQGTAHLTDEFRAIIGARYTDETKEFVTSRQLIRPGLYSLVIFPPTPEMTLERDEGNFDYSAALQYDLTADAMIYASVGKGTKAGGFAESASILSQSEFDAETSRTLEAGLKWSGSGWQLNSAVFSTDISGFQVVTFDGTRFVVNNTDLESQGFESEGFWNATRDLRLFGNVTYAKARNALNGERIPNAPDWSGSVGFDYERSLTNGLEFVANGTVDYRSDVTYQQNPDAAVMGEEFTTLNLTLGIADANRGWEVSLIGRNLTDENSASFAFPTPFVGASSATSEMPRTVALQARFQY